MAQDNNPDNDIEDDLDMDLSEDWDDLDQDEFEDDFSSDDEDVISSEVMDEDSEQTDNASSKSKKQKAPKEKGVKKKSGGGIIMGIMALATLGSVSWLALGNNPQILALVSGDQQQYLPVTVPPAQNQIDMPESDSLPPLDLGGQEEAPSEDVPHPGNADMHEHAAEDFVLSPAPSDEAVRPDYQDEVLTPMPDLETLSQDNGHDLASLRNAVPHDDAPQQTAELAPVTEETQETSISIDGLPEIDAPEIPDIAAPSAPENEQITLEEQKLLEETDKSFEDIAAPAPPLEVPQPTTEDIIPLDDSHKDIAVDAHTDLAQLQEPAPVEKPAPPKMVNPPQEAMETVAAEKPEASEEVLQQPVKRDVTPLSAPEEKPEVIEKTEPKTESSKKAEPAKVEIKPEAESASATPPKPVRLPVWELRSAATGTAVIYDRTTGNVLSIGVGSNVSGIGRVKSIERNNGKWLVTGTSGTIKQ